MKTGFSAWRQLKAKVLGHSAQVAASGDEPLAPSYVAPPKKSKKAENRGVALIMVLGSITILTILLAEFQDESTSEMNAAAVDRDIVKAEYAARSAVNLSRLLIAIEPTIRTAIGPLLAMIFGGSAPQIPVWEFSEGMLGAFNDQSGLNSFTALSGVDISAGKNLGMSGARFDVQIIDEDSKLNVNGASSGKAVLQKRLAVGLLGLMQGPQNDPLFEQRDGDGQFTDRQSLCAAVVDWTDGDENTFPCNPLTTDTNSNNNVGAEDSYYQMLKIPYKRKNAPFDSLDELRMVRGMSDDFWSTFVDPEPDSPKRRNVTVWGQGAVNVNSANPQTLYALICGEAVPGTQICEDPQEALKFLTALSMIRTLTAGAPMFGKPRSFIKALQGEGPVGQVLKELLSLPPLQFQNPQEIEKMVSTESKVFSIYSVGTVRSGKRETKVKIHAVVDFRKAPPPADMAAQLGLGSSSAGGVNTVPGTVPTTTGTSNVAAVSGTGTGEMDPNAIMAALIPNAGGQIVYYRIE